MVDLLFTVELGNREGSAAWCSAAVSERFKLRKERENLKGGGPDFDL